MIVRRHINGTTVELTMMAYTHTPELRASRMGKNSLVQGHFQLPMISVLVTYRLPFRSGGGGGGSLELARIEH